MQLFKGDRSQSLYAPAPYYFSWQGGHNAFESEAEEKNDVRWYHGNTRRKIWGCILSEEIHTRRVIDEALHLPSTYNHFNRWQTRFALYVTPDDANKQQTSVKRSAVVSQRPRWFPQQAMIIYGLTGASCRPEAFMQESPHCIFFSQHCLDLFFLGRARAHQPLVGWIVFFLSCHTQQSLKQTAAATTVTSDMCHTLKQAFFWAKEVAYMYAFV